MRGFFFRKLANAVEPVGGAAAANGASQTSAAGAGPSHPSTGAAAAGFVAGMAAPVYHPAQVQQG